MADKDLIRIEKDGNQMEVDERRFRLFYQSVGYKRIIENDEGQKITMQSKKEDIVSALVDAGIEYDPKDTKEELLKKLQGDELGEGE